MMISCTLNMAAALAINPILAVFSLKWGVSLITDAGIAIESLLFSKLVSSYFECLRSA
jgi:uncharacterized membrane protein YfbV (UPF0208 family)